MNELDRQALNIFRHEHEKTTPDPYQESRLLKSVQKATRILIKIIRSGDQGVIGDLLEHRAGIIARYGRVPSIPHLCAACLINTSEMVATAYIAQSLERRIGLPLYSAFDETVQTVCWYDVMVGATMTLGTIYVAEREIEGRSNQAIVGTAALESENEGDAAELYIRLQPELQHFSSEAAQLLLSEEGRTGLPLLDAQVQRLERVKLGQEPLSSPGYHPFQIVSMLLAGAEMARASYSVLYPLAKQLPPAQL